MNHPQSSEIKMELKTITPEWAAQILAHNNTRNRAMSRAHVEMLANEIRRGAWDFTGDTIKLSPDGQLIDGQHRLAAVVKAGVSIQTLVVEGVSFDVVATIDTRLKRRRATHPRIA
jgi:hypothetical protein